MQVLAGITAINYASNFYIYVLSGRKFRQELRKVLRIKRFRFSGFSGYSTTSRSTRDEHVMLSWLGELTVNTALMNFKLKLTRSFLFLKGILC